MDPECLPFTGVPHSTRLFTDFLYHFPNVQRFYPRPPALLEWFKDEQQRIQIPQDRRKRVAAILEGQNRELGAGAKTLQNIQRLKDGAPVIVTGQQVALFGGPTFSLLKALTVVLLAEKTGAVPVFWLATEDHDFAEINFVHLPAGDHLETLSTLPPHQEGLPSGKIVFDESISASVKQVEELLGNSTLFEVLKESYRPGENFGSAFGKFYARAFAELGLIFLNPIDPELHRIAQPVFRDSLRNWKEINGELQQREQELESAGYHAQVKVTASHTLCFYFRDGVRTPVRHDGENKFAIGDRLVTEDELIAETETHPERFSANVLLRPIMQDYLLPTLCYSGGPAETAYFAQVEVVYRKLLGRVTPVVPRTSATLVEPRQAKLLDRYQLKLTDLFTRGPEKLRELVAGKALPDSIMKSFDSAAEHLDQALSAIHGPLEKLDKTLADAAANAGSKMRYQLQSLRDKAARAESRKNAETQQHADELSTLLYPNKNLQEREIGSAYFLLKYGTAILEKLREKVQPNCFDHQIIPLG